MSRAMTEDPHVPPLQITLEIATSSSENPAQVERDYVIRIDNGDFAPATFAWDQALATDLAALRRADCDPEILQRLGQRLRQLLRSTDWPRHEAAILDAHARGAPVHITICSSVHAEELYALPWDLLALDASGQHLAELPGVLVRYAWRRSPTVTGEDDDEPGGRILLAWSAAAGEVPAGAHRDALKRACGKHSPVFESKRDVLPHVSWGRLEDALRGAMAHGQPVRVLHILCHGAVRGRSFCLAWNDDHSDEPAIIDAGRLRQLLAEYAPHLRMVVLCACDSSNESALGTQLGSLARNLHRVGIQTVIGSAVPLSGRGSIAFTESFYRALVADHVSVADAFLRARRALASHVRNLDWLALRFYAAPGDDQRDIFLPAPLPRARRPRRSKTRAELTPPEPRTRASLLMPLFTLIAGVALAILLLRYWLPLHASISSVAPDAAAPESMDAGLPDATPLPPAPVPAPESTPRPPPGPRPVDSRRFSFAAKDCRRDQEMIACRIQITSHGRSRKIILFTTRKARQSLLHDNKDRPTVASRAMLLGKRHHFGRVSATLPANRPVEAILEFKDATPRVQGVSRMALTYQDADFGQAATVYFWDVPFTP